MWCVELAIAVILGAGLASTAGAQQSVHLGVGGGAAIPTGQLDSLYSPGPGGLVTLAFGPPDAPMGLRLDYQYAGLQGKAIAGRDLPNTHISSVTANLVMAFRVGYVKPYLIGGGGWYPLRLAGDTKRQNDWGYNAGAGIGFPLPFTNVGAFVEARYHDVNRSDAPSYHFVPITIGLLF